MEIHLPFQIMLTNYMTWQMVTQGSIGKELFHTKIFPEYFRTWI